MEENKQSIYSQVTFIQLPVVMADVDKKEMEQMESMGMDYNPDTRETIWFVNLNHVVAFNENVNGNLILHLTNSVDPVQIPMQYEQFIKILSGDESTRDTEGE